MKYSAILLLISALSASAFAPAKPFGVRTTSLSAKGAKSKEEDLELTRKVIADFLGEEMGGGGDDKAEAPAQDEKKKKGKKGKGE